MKDATRVACPECGADQWAVHSRCTESQHALVLGDPADPSTWYVGEYLGGYQSGDSTVDEAVMCLSCDFEQRLDLPPLDLSARERAHVALALRAWRLTTLTGDRKAALSEQGHEVEPMSEPELDALVARTLADL